MIGMLCTEEEANLFLATLFLTLFLLPKIEMIGMLCMEKEEPDCIGHNYIGRDGIGHTYVGRDETDHNYRPHKHRPQACSHSYVGHSYEGGGGLHC